jgi:mono/diheme cytochrome c family protein
MILAAMKRRIAALAVLAVAASGLLTACGSQGVSSSVDQQSAAVQSGAKLFAQRCSGCHTFDAAGAQGSATKVSDREKVDGPNLNVRKVCYDSILYALQNGGYSGAIMPANIVVGKEAQQVAAFVATYSGEKAPAVASPTGPAVKCPNLPSTVGQ